MKPAEFDKFAAEYNQLMKKEIGLSDEGVAYFTEYKIKDLFAAAQERGLPKTSAILDFGTGIGNSIPFLKKYFPDSHLTGVDVSEHSLEIAQKRFSGQAEFVAFDGHRLPFKDGSFELVVAACVFHHIEPELRVSLVKEILRVLRPGGLFLLYEHNPLNPLTRKIVRECVFDEDAILISAEKAEAILDSAGFSRTRADFRLFFPKRFSFLAGIERYLTWFPLGAQYFVLGEK